MFVNFKSITLFILILVLTSTYTSAQNDLKVRGVVTEKQTGTPLEGVAVGVNKLPQRGMFTDENGKYELSLPKGKHTLVFNSVGYENTERSIDLNKTSTLNVELEESNVSLKEVVINARRPDFNVKDVQSGVEHLTVKTISKIPVLFGEQDILKTVQLLPGIQSAGEGNTGFYVRGGSDDQNLILLDNATVFNPSHLLGFFSTFNSDAVEDITIYKGSMPSKYGGRLSSTLDINMRDGDTEKYKVRGGVGIISSRLTAEGPIQKNKSSFIVSARRTYADVLAKGMGVKEVKNSSLYFYDLNAKVSYFLSDKDKLTVTAYHGRDRTGIADMMNVSWGNTIAVAKWNRRMSDKVSSNTSLSYTDYTYNVDINTTSDFTVKSKIRNFNIGQDFNIALNDKNKIQLGASSIYHQIIPGEIVSNDTTKMNNATPYQHRNAWENAIYASNDMKLSDKMELSYGLRVSSYSVLGGSDYYNIKGNNLIDTVHTKSGEFVKTYFNLEPRLSAAYQLGDNSSVKGSYTRTAQYVHLLTSNPLTSTFDRWTGSTNNIKPENAHQLSAGYFRNFDNNHYEFSIETYYKWLGNQIDYRDGARILERDNFEPDLLYGKGRAYGVEAFIKKKFGRFNGWVGYTLSWSQKKIDGINNNKWYATNQDRRHDISVVGIYELNKKWSLSGTWVYATGAPITLPSGKYVVDAQVVYYYDGRNNYRTPAYHRLDLGAICVLKDSKRYYSELSFGLYNAYGRKNAYMYDIRESDDNKYETEIFKIYLFTFIPSISWNFKF